MGTGIDLWARIGADGAVKSDSVPSTKVETQSVGGRRRISMAPVWVFDASTSEREDVRSEALCLRLSAVDRKRHLSRDNYRCAGILGGNVFTIEPEPTLAAAAKERFDSSAKVTVCEGLSEQVLPALLATLNGEMALWLDGHFSSGVTHEGPTVTPILAELSAVAHSVYRFDKVTLFIDDVRLFVSADTDGADYPPLGSLVRWAESSGLSWFIEHDIFVARSG